jgi:hypothetical protein
MARQSEIILTKILEGTFLPLVAMDKKVPMARWITTVLRNHAKPILHKLDYHQENYHELTDDTHFLVKLLFNQTHVIIDYFNSVCAPLRFERMSFAEALSAHETWVNKLNNNSEYLLGLTLEEELKHDVTLIFTQGDYDIVQLHTPRAYKREGIAMSHCVAGYYGEYESSIYSVRLRHTNQALLTIEMDAQESYISQLQGYNNEPVVQMHYLAVGAVLCAWVDTKSTLTLSHHYLDRVGLCEATTLEGKTRYIPLSALSDNKPLHIDRLKVDCTRDVPIIINHVYVGELILEIETAAFVQINGGVVYREFRGDVEAPLSFNGVKFSTKKWYLECIMVSGLSDQIWSCTHLSDLTLIGQLAQPCQWTVDVDEMHFDLKEESAQLHFKSSTFGDVTLNNDAANVVLLDCNIDKLQWRHPDGFLQTLQKNNVKVLYANLSSASICKGSWRLNMIRSPLTVCQWALSVKNTVQRQWKDWRRPPLIYIDPKGDSKPYMMVFDEYGEFASHRMTIGTTGQGKTSSLRNITATLAKTKRNDLSRFVLPVGLKMFLLKTVGCLSLKEKVYSYEVCDTLVNININSVTNAYRSPNFFGRKMSNTMNPFALGDQQSLGRMVREVQNRIWRPRAG